MAVKKALITGIYGQDGSYIAELLKKKGYLVYGLIQENLSANAQKIKKYLEKKNIVDSVYVSDVSNYNNVKTILLDIQPDEIYHMAAFHVSSESKVNNLRKEMLLFEKNVISTLNILTLCSEYLTNTKIVTAGSCLIFDSSKISIQNESTPFSSNSLYGLAKISELNLVKYYRLKGLFVSTAILYNHESSRRKDTFVTKKIVKNLLAVKRGEIKKFTLGNIDVRKDWGYARDYVDAMYLMNQQNFSDDYIISSGSLHSIREFIEIVAQKLNILDWEKYIVFDQTIISRDYGTTLFGDATLAKKKLGWKSSTSLHELINIMVKNELESNME